jgi:lipocalin
MISVCRWCCCVTVVIILMVLTGPPKNAVMGQPTVTSSSKPYAPIATLDTPAYLGRWYQMATGASFLLLELGGNCVTADYKLRSEDGKISLVNQARPLLIPQLFARTTGYVVQSKVPTEQGAFTVDQTYLFGVDPDSVEYEAPGNYWIIGLGPLINGQYQWAAVSNGDRTSVFILARNVKEYNKKYKQDAKQVFKDFGGFNNLFTNVLIDTPHFLCFGYK